MEAKCKGCSKVLPATTEYFGREKRNKSGLTGKCKKCLQEHVSNWMKSNPEKAAIINKRKNKKHYEKNKEERRRMARERMATPEAKARARVRMRELRKNPIYRMRSNTSRAIRAMLNGNIKSSRTFDALPYTPEQLAEHLEKQFDDKMTWDNYGSYWDIDHIYPQSRLPYDSMEHPNFAKCWALENLRPLEHKANIIKGNRVLSEGDEE